MPYSVFSRNPNPIFTNSCHFQHLLFLHLPSKSTRWTAIFSVYSCTQAVNYYYIELWEGLLWKDNNRVTVCMHVCRLFALSSSFFVTAYQLLRCTFAWQYAVQINGVEKKCDFSLFAIENIGSINYINIVLRSRKTHFMQLIIVSNEHLFSHFDLYTCFLLTECPENYWIMNF